MWAESRCGAVAVAVLVTVGACTSSASNGAGTTTSSDTIAVSDDRSGQSCAVGDASGGTFDEPEVPAPTIVDVEQYAGLTHDHVDGCVDYAQNPPAGGDHRGVWQSCRFYDRAVPPEQGVHSMEHGAVWITYDPTLPSAQRAALADLASDFVLVSPWNRDPLPAPIVASAWGLQLALDSAADPRLVEFVKTYANGPQNSEPGAPCRRGGTSKTL